MGDLRGTSTSEETITLGIDTSSRRSFVSLHKDEVCLKSSAAEELGSAEVLSGLTRMLCEEVNVDINQLSQIAVCLGPGSYTGIRTGLASSYGLAFALDIPLVGVSGLLARVKPFLGTTPYLLSYQKASKADCYWSLCKAIPKGKLWEIEILQSLSVSLFEAFEADTAKVLSENGIEHSQVTRAAVDHESEALTESLASYVAWAATHLLCPAPELQRGDKKSSLEPLYGKGANAKTLVERGIKKH